MTIPNYLYDGLLNKTVYFTYVNSGSYSIGYKMEFIKNIPENISDILFLKMIPLSHEVDNKEVFMQFNCRKIIYTSTESMFDKEVDNHNYVYNNEEKRINLPLYDHFILDSQKTFTDKISDLQYFFQSLSMMEISSVIDENYLRSCLNCHKESIKLGIIIMPYMDCISGYNYFRLYTSPSKIFGKFFDATLLIQEIRSGVIKSNSLFILVQIIYRILKLFKMKCIHYDLHLGNVMISPNEIVTNKAYDKDGKINPVFIGRVYIIDYGNAYISEEFDREVLKCVNKKKRAYKDYLYDSTNVYQVIEMLGRKIIYDGYNRDTKQMTMEWYLYDWYFNIFFDNNFQIRHDVVEKIILFTNDLENEINDFNENFRVDITPSNYTLCCFPF